MGIIGIKEFNFNLNFQHLNTIQEIDPSQLQVGIRTVTDIKREEEIVQITTGVQYKYKDEILLVLDVASFFTVSNLSSMMGNNKKEINFENDVLPTLLNISIGNLRGMMQAKIATTKLEPFPLILIDMEELVARNVVNKPE